MTELQGHEDRLEISADSGVFVRSRAEGLHGRSRVGGSAPALCQRAGCYQSHPWDLPMILRLASIVISPRTAGLDHATARLDRRSNWLRCGWSAETCL